MEETVTLVKRAASDWMVSPSWGGWSRFGGKSAASSDASPVGLTSSQTLSCGVFRELIWVFLPVDFIVERHPSYQLVGRLGSRLPPVRQCHRFFLFCFFPPGFTCGENGPPLWSCCLFQRCNECTPTDWNKTRAL